MTIKSISVKGFYCPTKHILVIDEKPIIVANSPKKVSDMIQYIEGYISELPDKKVMKILDKFKKEGKT